MAHDCNHSHVKENDWKLQGYHGLNSKTISKDTYITRVSCYYQNFSSRFRVNLGQLYKISYLWPFNQISSFSSWGKKAWSHETIHLSYSSQPHTNSELRFLFKAWYSTFFQIFLCLHSIWSLSMKYSYLMNTRYPCI